MSDASSGSQAGVSPLLEVREITVRFGGVLALESVSLSVAEGTIAALIGPNGAGKSTLFNCVSRLVNPRSGSIMFAGHDLLARRTHQVTSLGIARTFQNTALFADLSVRDNLMLGAHHQLSPSPIAAALRLPSVQRRERDVAARVDAVIESLGLDRIATRFATELEFPVQKRVELGRALVSKPRLVLLDEPAGGLNHSEVDELVDVLERVRADFDLTILLVEHHMSMVMRVADRITVLDSGRRIADGTPAEVQVDPAVVEAYLGTGRQAR